MIGGFRADRAEFARSAGDDEEPKGNRDQAWPGRVGLGTIPFLRKYSWTVVGHKPRDGIHGDRHDDGETDG
ncbi:MAG: hypothetical protein ACR2OO_04705, partial [Thermomicrobiales bacterium]